MAGILQMMAHRAAAGLAHQWHKSGGGRSRRCGTIGPMRELLDNIMWNCMAGPQARFATGAGAVRRYAPGFSPIIGCEDPQKPDFVELARHCEIGEHFYAHIWSGAAPSGWQIDKEAMMFKMIWEAPMPPEDPAPDAVALRPEHAPQALGLAQLTNPGPFGIRTPELGEYFGYFDGGRLIAMAGERMEAGTLREVSGICTDPAFQGRGLARKLTLKLLDPALQGVVHRVFFTLGQMNMTSESSAQQRLLIVEDDVHMAYLLGYLAEREHFQVESIADGRQAVQRINAGPAVDLVLLDIMLPYMDGFELLARLRANPAWEGVPVIILTSKTREHDAVRALDLGADDFLTKPFSPSELVARIRRRLRPPQVAPP